MSTLDGTLPAAHSRPRSPATGRRVLCGLTAAAALAGAVFLAAHHPLSATLVLVAALALTALTAVRPALWPLWLLPLLPLIGLMPWTGWLTVEEMDIAVLAVAAGGYLRLAGGWPRRGAAARVSAPASASASASVSGAAPATRSLTKVVLWLLPLLLSTLISGWRGIVDAGGFEWGWWQGYQEPLNSVRLAKPLFEVLLLLPLWRAACRADRQRAPPRLALAISALLLAVALAVVWERQAFTGLLDFSTDYRATGPFWEMHVGGAALDAVLALTLPFALMLLTSARTPLRWAAAAAVLALGLYAALATFSRIVYAALPVGFAFWWALRAAAARSRGQPVAGVLPAIAGLLLFGLLADASFVGSGYRGLIALLASVALLLPLAPRLRSLTLGLSLASIGAGLAALALVAAMTAWLPKGAYLAFAASWGFTALALAGGRPRAALAGFIATLGAQVAVALHWGGVDALPAAVGLSLVLLTLAAVGALRATPTWPLAWRWQASFFGALVAAAGLVGVLGGGAYMEGRIAASVSDGQSRIDHWRQALALLGPMDQVLGKGLGRYWATQSLSGRAEDQTGDLRYLPSGGAHGGPALILTSGRHDLGWSEALRLSQRIAEPAPGPLKAKLHLKTETGTKLQVEVCEKHLLYPRHCLATEYPVAAQPGIWQEVSVPLAKGDAPQRGVAWAPRLIVFTIGLGRHQNRIEIDHVQLEGSDGRQMLANGDLAQGMAHWFYTSDRYHLPWHMKNLVGHLLFEQGLLGLLSFGLALGAAVWRTTLGAARSHPLAPALAAGLVGAMVVGLVDSLFDMPRVAFLILLLLALALALPRTHTAVCRGGS